MKALSIKQPWADLIVSGKKTIETRTWKTSFRGDILVVTSMRPQGILPGGHAVAVATIADCRPMTREDEVAACCAVYERAHSWVLENVRKIKPFPVKGKLSLYEVDVCTCNLLELEQD